MDAIEVGVLGATGVVGQQFVSRLARHPWFRVTWLAASERSRASRTTTVAPWRLAAPMPGASADRTVEACVPGKGPKVVFSGLDASVAGDIEGAFAAAGHIVVSNARNFRMDPLVPLLIPEINRRPPEAARRAAPSKGWSGAIVTNPNCSTIVLAMALAPLRQFDIRAVVVSTMQAVSGAGYPGVPSLDILGNVVPFIGGEEEKMESETLKILGSDGGRAPYPAVVSAHTNRVAVIDGHTMTVSVDVRQQAVDRRHRRGDAHVPGRPQELWLPSAPQPPIVRDRRSRTGRSRGSTPISAAAWRSRSAACAPCPVMHAKFVALGHNTIRGAAGAAILNAELMHAEGLLG